MAEVRLRMIAVDTDVPVRYLTNDDADQARKAMELLATSEAVLLPRTVLLDLEWVLRAVYGLSREVIHNAILHTLGLPNVRVERAEQIAKAMGWYRQGMDFADALHLTRAVGAERLVTFDRRFAGSAAAQHLPVDLL